MVQTLAILYGTKGGMGDVGKFAVVQAVEMPDVRVRVVALALDSKDGSDNGVQVDFEKCPHTKHRCPVDVKDEQVRASVKAAFEGLKIQKMDVADASTHLKLEEVFDGVDAVVACLGNRQNFSCWLADGMAHIVAAMNAKGIKRITNLSSFGIGDDYLPMSCIKALWWTILHTINRGARKDLIKMEAVLFASGVDYVNVRAMGLDPSEHKTGQWKVLHKRGEGRVAITSSKEDVASYLLEEALRPTLHRVAVTVGKSA